jgi:hypothetical protein
MKNILVAAFILSSVYSFSQATSRPVIKQGAKLSYAIATDEGSLPLLIKLDSLTNSYVRFTWSTPNVGKGTWILRENTLEKATNGYWGQLEPDSEILLPENQSIVIFSKTQWTKIQKDKKTDFDGVTYALKTTPQPSKLNLKDVDALYLENENGTTKIWLLNNATFPAILKIEGNIAGPDVELKSVE